MTPATDSRRDEDLAEIAYLAGRRLARRRQALSIALILGFVLGFLGWVALRHALTSLWFDSNQFDVSWSIDKGNWTRGGATVVRYSSGAKLFSSERPLVGLDRLTNLLGVEELDLASLGGVKDSDLEFLDRLTQLRRLNLDRPRSFYAIRAGSPGLTDETLAKIGRLSGLEDLNLGGQSVTDAGLDHLSGLARLQTLDLAETSITDAGLSRLRTLPALKVVVLTGSRVTAQGLAEFEAARPGVNLVADAPPGPPDPRAAR